VAAAVRRAVKFISWLLPHGLYVLRKKLREPAAAPSLVGSQVLEKNADVHNRHLGKRCFILGNGPSVKSLDLLRLKGEVVISVSNGYLHSDFVEFKPLYHCVPQITYGQMTTEDVIKWFSEMHEKLGNAVLFMNETEAGLVREQGLFPGRKLHFLAMRESFDEMTMRQIVDVTAPVPRAQSVPVMAIMIAMYMGFTEVVLLGMDHDHFKDGKYTYAFDLGVQKDKDQSVAADGQVKTSWYDDFQSLARLWRQYRVLGEIAKANGVKIVNATPGGELDEFERVPYQTLFPRAP
jgi:hypothetical protein